MENASPGRRALALLGLLVLLACPALAVPAADQAEEATLELWNRPIVVLRKTVGERTPAQRAAGAAVRLAMAPTEFMRGDVSIARFSSEYGEGLELEVRGSAAPAPYVVQRALSDIYVEYQLVAVVERSEDRPLALSRLNAAIEDAFNEHGVQIMSPHFRGQPHAPVLVPPERWHAPPAPKP